MSFCKSLSVDSICSTCYEEDTNEKYKDNKYNICTHSIVFNIGLRLSRKRITLQSQCKYGYYIKSPTCHNCKIEFNHLEWCSYLWGCIPCFKKIFSTKRKIENILLCEKCVKEICLFYEKDQITGLFKLIN